MWMDVAATTDFVYDELKCADGSDPAFPGYSILGPPRM